MIVLNRTPVLFLLFLANLAWAQPSEAQRAEWRAAREAREAQDAGAGERRGPPPGVTRGEYSGPRPPADASPEEKKAFWQAIAAERKKAEEGAQPEVKAKPGDASATPGRRESAGSERAAQKPATNDPHAGHVMAADGSMSASAGSTQGSRSGGSRSTGGVLWLSDTPPSRGDGGSRGGMGMGGMGGMGMGGGPRSGPPVKKLWLRSGTDPVKSGFAREDTDAPGEVLLVTPKSPLEGEPLPAGEDGRKNLSFEMPVQGYYRLYLTSRKVQGDALSVSVAKTEVANFSHGGNEEERAQSVNAPRVLESAAIEIVREKAPDEKTFFQLKSGDQQAFFVLQKGVPVQGARVRFVSHEGWVKEAVSDEQGRVGFQVIRDYFPPWDEFKKRFKASYLVIAEVGAAEKGSFKDQPYSNVRYQATLAGNYYPSPDDYRSYAWGLGIGLLITLFCGVAIYLYRRRRVKPFQEVRFDEAK